jgi:hypothetical protein
MSPERADRRHERVDPRFVQAADLGRVVRRPRQLGVRAHATERRLELLGRFRQPRRGRDPRGRGDDQDPVARERFRGRARDQLAGALDVPVPGERVFDQEHNGASRRLGVRRAEEDDGLARPSLDHLEVLRAERGDRPVFRVDGHGVDPDHLRCDREHGSPRSRRLLRERRGEKQQGRAGRGEDACDQRATLSWAQFRTKPST